VMASTLMQIKSQMLLPAPDAAEEETGPDPRSELVNKLLEYQRFKDAAGVLSVYNEKAKDIYYRRTPPSFEQEDFLLRATVIDLLAAFKRVLDQAPHEVVRSCAMKSRSKQRFVRCWIFWSIRSRWRLKNFFREVTAELILS